MDIARLLAVGLCTSRKNARALVIGINFVKTDLEQEFVQVENSNSMIRQRNLKARLEFGKDR